ncbi:hypothetical protein ACFYW6_31090 [Streptomyces sp. NPDC002659]|uniref:AMIN-like domain-containing (lipo)protein n=1 Tax=Streptomyces sp. NPDC002659 TaxID=3364656 RepID=UPI00367B1E4E
MVSATIGALAEGIRVYAYAYGYVTDNGKWEQAVQGLWAVSAALVLAGAGLTGTAVPSGAAMPGMGATASASACSTAWGSGVKTAAEAGAVPLRNVTVSRGACFDRTVFHVTGASAKVGHHVGYVETFRQDGSGDPIPVRGGAILQIFVSAPSYDPVTLQPTYAGRAGKPLPGVNVAGYKTFRDTRFGASFEGQTQVGLGVRARLPFRVLQTRDKLIVDVAHTW